MLFDIYLVSLKSDDHRRCKLQEQFPLTYEKFILKEAVDGRLLPAKDFYSHSIKYYDRKKVVMTPSEVGCTLSHIKVLSSFLETDAEYALIMEDDIIGTDEDFNKIQKLLPEIGDDAVLICGGQEGLLSRFFQLGKSINPLGNLFSVHPFSFQYIYRTCCYVVTRNSARSIIGNHNEKFTIADDWSAILDNNINLYYANILHHPLDLSESTIEKERLLGGARHNLLDKLLSFKKLAKTAYSFVVLVFLIVFGYRRLR